MLPVYAAVIPEVKDSSVLAGKDELEIFHNRTMAAFEELSQQMGNEQRKMFLRISEIVAFNMHHLTVLLGFCVFALLALLALNAVSLYVLLVRRSNNKTSYSDGNKTMLR
jgi:hypothetical protein